MRLCCSDTGSFDSWYNVLFVGGRFLVGSVELAEDLSRSSSSLDSSQKALVLVSSSSGNGWTVMLGLAM